MQILQKKGKFILKLSEVNLYFWMKKMFLYRNYINEKKGGSHCKKKLTQLYCHRVKIQYIKQKFYLALKKEKEFTY